MLHPQSIIVPLFALPASFLGVCPFIIQTKARNLPAATLIGGFILANTFNFLNALLWPTNIGKDSYNGVGLCDVEAKLYMGITACVSGATASIFRQLAHTVDSSRIGNSESDRQLLCTRVFYVSTCIAFPVYLMAVHYVVQPDRYILRPVYGCTTSIYPGWVAILVWGMWPVIMYVMATGYGVVASCRILKHRREVRSILTESRTTKSRYYRLFTIATLLLIFNLPLSVWLLCLNLSWKLKPYQWDRVHPPDWSRMIRRLKWDDLNPGNAVDRYLQIAAGYILFMFFGLGDDAKAIYTAWIGAMFTVVRRWKWRPRRQLWAPTQQLDLSATNIDLTTRGPASTRKEHIGS